ncbi:MAG: PD40 domain-containing protein, partial [Acidobacteria bacterium]|nr:PD40 domain-containing protein [Acidobacteriota bacterium]
MTIVDLLDIPSVTDPRLSPDGEEMLFVLAQADWKENKRVPQVWRASRGGGDSMQLTFGKDGASEPRWSPDGSWIAFLAKRDGDEETQIYLLPRRGGEGRRLSTHPTSVSDLAWAPDGKSLYFLASDEKTEEEKKRDEAKDDVFAFDENFKQQHLWRIALPADPKEKAEAERLSEGDFSVRSFEVSADGTLILSHRAPTPLFDDTDESEIWLLRLEGKQWRRLTENRVPESGATLSPDGSTVLFVAGANADFELYYNDKIFLVPAAGGAARLLLPDLPYEVGEARWSKDGASIFFTANTGVRSELFKVEVESREVTQLTCGEHAVVRWHYLPQRGEHLLSIDEITRPGDLWLLSDGGELRQVTHLFDELASRFQLPRQEAFRWKGEDGQEAEGLLFY